MKTYGKRMENGLKLRGRKKEQGKRNEEETRELERGKWNEEDGMKKTELMNGDRNIKCGATPTTKATTATTTTTTTAIRK